VSPFLTDRFLTDPDTLSNGSANVNLSLPGPEQDTAFSVSASFAEMSPFFPGSDRGFAVTVGFGNFSAGIQIIEVSHYAPGIVAGLHRSYPHQGSGTTGKVGLGLCRGMSVS